MNDFSGLDESGQPLYRNTADGPQCTTCGQLSGQHDDDCPNAPVITDADIAALRDEAGTAGDIVMAGICTAALEGSLEARAECERVITTATREN
jgi:hypothetical protein